MWSFQSYQVDRGPQRRKLTDISLQGSIRYENALHVKGSEPRLVKMYCDKDLDKHPGFIGNIYSNNMKYISDT